MIKEYILNHLCADAFAFNVMARERKLAKWQAEMFYEIKNDLVEYLYKFGYCIDARKHIKKFECWNCDGTGKDDWNDGCDCISCNGTGIHHQFILYAFAFRVGKRIWKWNQPYEYVTWPVTLTESAEADYAEPQERNIDIIPEDRKKMVFEMWLCLILLGFNPGRLSLMQRLARKVNRKRGK